MTKPSLDSPPPDEGHVETLWSAIDTLRRKMDEHAIVGKRTQQTLGQLTDVLAAQAKANRRRLQWANLHTFGAYFAITLVLSVAAVLLYRARVGQVMDDAHAARLELAATKAQLEAARTATVANAAASAKAWSGYQLAVAGKLSEAIAVWQPIDHGTLSELERAVLAGYEDRFVGQRREQEYRVALAAFRAHENAQAIDVFSRLLAAPGQDGRDALMYYYLGVTKWRMKDMVGAQVALRAAVDRQVDMPDARWYLAQVLMAQGQYEAAKAELAAMKRKGPRTAAAPAAAPVSKRGTPLVGPASPRPGVPR